jgi:hypothetical protein
VIAAIYARKSTEQDVSDDAIARPEPRPVAPLGASEIFYVGRMMRSARSRRCRAISIGSPLSTSVAASSKTSYCAYRISASMISTARSFCPRLGSPAVRYHTLSARSWGVMRHDDSKALRARAILTDEYSRG